MTDYRTQLSFSKMDDNKAPEVHHVAGFPDGYHVPEEPEPVETIIHLPLEHPLLKKAQEQLAASLLQSSREIDELILHQRAALKQANIERERCGLGLSSKQEVYNSLKRSLESTAKEYETTLKKHEDSRSKLADIRLGLAARNGSFKDVDGQRIIIIRRAADISREISDLGNEKEKLEHQVLVSKRSASKAEQDLREREEFKIAQDLLVDSLNTTIDRLKSEIDLFQARLDRHQTEDRGSDDILAAARIEIDAVLMEKKRLLSQWKSAVVALERKDAILAKCNDSIRSVTDFSKTLKMELKGRDAAIRDVTIQHERVASIAEKLQSNIKHTEEQLEECLAGKDTVVQKIALLQKSVEMSEKDLALLSQRSRLLFSEIEQTVSAFRKTTAELQVLSMDTMKLLVSRASFDRSMNERMKDGIKTRQEVQEIELGIAQQRNISARLQLESLDLMRTIDQLRQTLSEVEKMADDENLLGERYITESRMRSIEYASKQSELEALNRKYDKIVYTITRETGAVAGEIGPLEAAIHNLSKSIKIVEDETLELEQQWIRSQNVLISSSKKTEDAQLSLLEFKARKDVVERKIYLLEQSFNNEQSEIAAANRNRGSIQSQVERLNTLLHKTAQTYSQISDATLEAEILFKQRLRDAEVESNRLEERVETIIAESAHASERFVEAEYVSLFSFFHHLNHVLDVSFYCGSKSWKLRSRLKRR
eukprot:Partr_v1_DN28984_c1_g1_i4_m25971 putative coiled-coil domain containing 40